MEPALGKVKLIRVRRSSNRESTDLKSVVTVGNVKLSAEAKRNVNRVLNSNRLSYGPFSRRFESRFAALHDSKFGILTNSGTSSLQIALAALKEKHNWQNGDEVIVPAITFIATSNAVIQNGLKPVFVDVQPDTYTLDPTLLAENITERTRAVIPVHLLGLPCNMDPILSIARKHGIRIVEDSAECFLARYHGRSVGSFGDIGIFSLYVAHYIVAGIGGINITSDPKLALVLRSLVNHGRDPAYLQIEDDDNLTSENLNRVVARRFSFVRIGYSYRLTELEAAIGCAALAKADEIIRRRREIAHKYMAGLTNLSEYLQLPTEPRDRDHNFMLFGVIAKQGNKRRLVQFLEENQIETRDIPSLLYQPVYGRLYGNIADKLPVARSITKSGFYIGCHEGLRNQEIEHVIKTFHHFFRR